VKAAPAPQRGRRSLYTSGAGGEEKMPRETRRATLLARPKIINRMRALDLTGWRMRRGVGQGHAGTNWHETWQVAEADED
jgi:hypothetical protein